MPLLQERQTPLSNSKSVKGHDKRDRFLVLKAKSEIKLSDIPGKKLYPLIQLSQIELILSKSANHKLFLKLKEFEGRRNFCFEIPKLKLYLKKNKTARIRAKP